MLQLKKQRDGREQKGRMESGEKGIPDTAEIYALGKVRANIKLALKQKTLEQWEEAWLNQKKEGDCIGSA